HHPHGSARPARRRPMRARPHRRRGPLL
ncbi:MAG: hypothetical protein AVDCRST_MAG66-4540, partial [uncultured Pseudonocardia sp.]